MENIKDGFFKEFFGSKLAYCKRFILKLVLTYMIPIVNMLSNFFEAQHSFKFDFAKPRRKLFLCTDQSHASVTLRKTYCIVPSQDSV
jgi:hypothetical protein